MSVFGIFQRFYTSNHFRSSFIGQSSIMGVSLAISITLTYILKNCWQMADEEEIGEDKIKKLAFSGTSGIIIMLAYGFLMLGIGIFSIS